MSDSQLAWQVEEACMNAWPALRHVFLNGWLLRFSEGSRTRRINSINPMRPVADLSSRDLETFEMLYRARKLAPVFRIPQIARGGVEAMLDGRGYRVEGETLTLISNPEDVQCPDDDAVRLTCSPDARWLAAIAAIQGHSEKEHATYGKILNLIVLPKVFAAVEREGRTVAVAYGVMQRPLVCLESVATAPDWRRRGLARAVISAILASAAKQGAERACLQVQADNAAALSLYRSLGFDTELYRYHYRRAPAEISAIAQFR